MYRIFRTAAFVESVRKLGTAEQRRVERILGQLLQQADSVGKPLAGLTFFREKKFDGKWLYFLVYQSLSVVLAAAISDKKAQQSTIEQVLRDLGTYPDSIVRALEEKVT